MTAARKAARLLAGAMICVSLGCGSTSTRAPTDPDSSAGAASLGTAGTAGSAGAAGLGAAGNVSSAGAGEAGSGSTLGGRSNLPECVPSTAADLPAFITPLPDPALPVEYSGRGLVQSITDVALTIALEPSGQLELQRLALPQLAKAGDELAVKVHRVGSGPEDEDMAFELRNAEGELLLFSYQMPFDATVFERLGAPVTLAFEALCDDTRRDNCHSEVNELVTIVSHDDGQVRAQPRTSQAIQVGGRAFSLNVYFARELGLVTCSPAFDQPAPGIHTALQLVAQTPAGAPQ